MENMKRCNTCEIDKEVKFFDPKNNVCKKCKNTRHVTKNKVHRPNHHILTHSRKGANARDIEFSITLSDIVIPSHCPYLGIPLSMSVDGITAESTPSLDRIDNSKGYVPGNVQVISVKANRMKNNATREQLLLFAKAIIKMEGLL